jgi:hypothetical protein
VADYFKEVEPRLKEAMADGLSNLTTDDIKQAGSVKKAMEKKENEARSS